MLRRWENYATAVAMQCHPVGTTMRRKQENYATKVEMRFQGRSLEPTWNRT
ncbi:MAG: hypothetical protein IJ901_01220 [Bacteroidaceae bacterium]|nr:hypothetical protein [Bacteroidaceae bacterium]